MGGQVHALARGVGDRSAGSRYRSALARARSRVLAGTALPFAFSARHRWLTNASTPACAESGAPRISAFLPGASKPALDTALALGMRITCPMLLTSSRDFGDWAQYLTRNPGFM
jgi:hypothetical protein